MGVSPYNFPSFIEYTHIAENLRLRLRFSVFCSFRPTLCRRTPSLLFRQGVLAFGSPCHCRPGRLYLCRSGCPYPDWRVGCIPPVCVRICAGTLSVSRPARCPCPGWRVGCIPPICVRICAGTLSLSRPARCPCPGWRVGCIPPICVRICAGTLSVSRLVRRLQRCCREFGPAGAVSSINSWISC
jgi:hypothetical protein